MLHSFRGCYQTISSRVLLDLRIFVQAAPYRPLAYRGTPEGELCPDAFCLGSSGLRGGDRFCTHRHDGGLAAHRYLPLNQSGFLCDSCLWWGRIRRHLQDSLGAKLDDHERHLFRRLPGFRVWDLRLLV